MRQWEAGDDSLEKVERQEQADVQCTPKQTTFNITKQLVTQYLLLAQY